MCSGRGEHQDGGSLALTGARCCWNQSGDKNPCDGLCSFHDLSLSCRAGWNALAYSGLDVMAKEAAQHIPDS